VTISLFITSTRKLSPYSSLAFGNHQQPRYQEKHSYSLCFWYYFVMGNDKGNRSRSLGSDDKDERSFCGPRFMAITGILTVLLVIAVIHVATSENKKTYFDELLSTGGAIRSTRFARSHDETTRLSKPGGQCHTAQCKKVAEYLKYSMYLTKDPCDDFYEYVCGGWKKKNPIPKSSSSYSTFTKLHGKVEKILRKILEDGIGNITGATETMMKMPTQIYQSCMDLKSIEATADKPLRKLIKQMGSWSIDEKSADWNEKSWDFEDTLQLIHQKYTSAGGPLFSVHVSDDPVHNNRHIIDVSKFEMSIGVNYI